MVCHQGKLVNVMRPGQRRQPWGGTALLRLIEESLVAEVQSKTLLKQHKSASEQDFGKISLDSCGFLGYFYSVMNDDEDLTVIQTDEDRRQLEKRILEELDEDITNIEMQEKD